MLIWRSLDLKLLGQLLIEAAEARSPRGQATRREASRSSVSKPMELGEPKPLTKTAG